MFSCSYKMSISATFVNIAGLGQHFQRRHRATSKLSLQDCDGGNASSSETLGLGLNYKTDFFPDAKCERPLLECVDKCGNLIPQTGKRIGSCFPVLQGILQGSRLKEKHYAFSTCGTKSGKH